MVVVDHKRGLLAVVLASLLVGCPPAPDDDDSTVVVADDDDATGDDDDTTPPPDPLAPVIGLFNLTNVVQAEGVSYVDFSGAFGSFVEQPDAVLSPAAYLGTFQYGADAPYWRIDLGGYPIPPLGEAEFVDMLAWYPWVPGEQTWWDGGDRIGLGNYLTGRLDFEDVTAYMVDDPVSPGAAAWTPGGVLSWQSELGEHVIDHTALDAIPLPEAVTLVEPAAFSTVEAPSALDLEVRWLPGSEGAFVTVGLIADGYAYIAHVPDNGEHVIPAVVLHDDFGPGPVELVVGRNLQSVLPHPQGDIIVRTREERRATVDLLPDIVIDPPYGQAGDTVGVEIAWFRESLSAGLTVDFGEGVVAGAVTPDPSDIHRATVQLQVLPEAAPGGRDVVLTTAAGTTETLLGGFAVLDLLPSDDCAGAEAEAPLETGVYHSTTVGLTDDLNSGYACLTWSLNGADAIYRVEMEPNDTLIALLDMPAPGDGALALLSTCGDPASAVACADAGVLGDPEALAYTSTSGGTYYLVIDAWATVGGDGFAAPWQLDLTVEQDVIDPDWIVPGESRAFTLFGESPWDAGILPSDIHLGAGVAAGAASLGSVPTELDFLATAAVGAVPGPRDVLVDNGAAGTVSFDEALWVTGWPPWDACAVATAADGVAPGSATGYGAGATNTLSDIPCMPYESVGPEVILPLDLVAGEMLDAAVTMPIEDAQLYVLSDCGQPESCFAGAVADDTVQGEEEAIVGWVAPESGRYYLVVDIYGGVTSPLAPWQFDLSIQIQ
jgi:hypothetical protein